MGVGDERVSRHERRAGEVSGRLSGSSSTSITLSPLFPRTSSPWRTQVCSARVLVLCWLTFASGFFKGTSADQDRRFSDKELKLLKTMKFPPEFDKKVRDPCTSFEIPC